MLVETVLRKQPNLTRQTDDLGPWNIPRHHINTAYIKAYHDTHRPSEPQEDMHDRLILYRLFVCYPLPAHVSSLALLSTLN